MKLIIDIDDNVFTRLFDNGVDTSSDDREVIDRAVRNGMPYEESPQGDLISRGALKEEVERIFRVGSYHKDRIIYLIDNASTVDTTCPHCDSGYAQGYSDGYLKGKEERPQGEWKVKTLSTFPQYQPDEYSCPFCNTIVNYKTNYCHKCGARLKGGAE